MTSTSNGDLDPGVGSAAYSAAVSRRRGSRDRWGISASDTGRPPDASPAEAWDTSHDTGTSDLDIPRDVSRDAMLRYWHKFQAMLEDPTAFGKPPGGSPTLLAHLTEELSFARRRSQKTDVLIVVYDDGSAITRYFLPPLGYAEGAQADDADEIGGTRKDACRVVDVNPSPKDPSLTVADGTVELVITPKSRTSAAEVVRSLAQRTAPTAAARLDGDTAAGLHPPPRLVRDAREAEELAAEWMRALGAPAAHTTPAGADGGIDITDLDAGGSLVGQVKFEAVRTSRQTLQALVGAGHGAGASAYVFFSSAGYTRQAVSWAGPVGMALFRFTIDGSVQPENQHAERLLRRYS